MDDLSSMLNNLLSDPNTMEQIKNLAGSLGQSAPAAAPPAAAQHQVAPANPLAGLDLSSLAGLLGNLTSQPAPSPSSAPAVNVLSGLMGNNGGGVDGDILQTVMKLAPLLSAFRQEDDNTRLLHALRPLLKTERQKKLDEAAKMLQLMKLLPLLKEQGILKGLLG